MGEPGTTGCEYSCAGGGFCCGWPESAGSGFKAAPHDAQNFLPSSTDAPQLSQNLI